MRITKNINRPHIIRYIRDNGTETWMYSDDFFVRHDLSHYAFESVMHYKTAFNGMLNNGMDIKDFDDREKRLKLTVTAEAMYAENTANLFLMEMAQGELEDFNQVQQAAFVSFNRQFPVLTLTPEQIEKTRKYLRSLLKQWNELPVGETLELIFSV